MMVKIFGNNIKVGSALSRLGLLCLFSLLCIFLSCISVLAGSYKPITATITVNCLEVKKVDSFKYKIKIKPQNNAPAPTSDELDIIEDNKGEFKVQVTEPGTYDYLIYQVEGDDDTMDYDQTQFEAHLFVTTDDNGELQYTVSVNIANTAKKPLKIEFVNKVSKGGADDTEDTTETPTEVTTEKKTEKKTENKTSDDGNDGGKDKSKKTGDETYLFVWINIFAISFVGIIVLVIERKRRYNQDE